jgi:voltage-gated potassium channel
MKMTLIPQAAAAVLLLILTLCLQCAGVAALIEWLRSVTAKSPKEFGPIRSAVLVVKLTIAIIILHGLVILLWTSFYRLQCFSSWELAFYFSSSSYATVGYGDVTLPSKWRLLGPLESMTGVLMCGVSVCLLFATITRLIDRDARFSRNERDPNEHSMKATHPISGFNGACE